MSYRKSYPVNKHMHSTVKQPVRSCKFNFYAIQWWQVAIYFFMYLYFIFYPKDTNKKGNCSLGINCLSIQFDSIKSVFKLVFSRVLFLATLYMFAFASITLHQQLLGMLHSKMSITVLLIMNDSLTLSCLLKPSFVMVQFTNYRTSIRSAALLLP